MLKANHYLVIQGWMIQGLGLYGTELIIYSIIYSFCQDGTSKKITIEYFRDWVLRKYKNSKSSDIESLSRRVVLHALQSLEEKKLIIITREPGKCNSYSINEETMREGIIRTINLNNEEEAKQKQEDASGEPNHLNSVVKAVIDQYDSKKKDSAKKETSGICSDEVSLDDLNSLASEFNL